MASTMSARGYQWGPKAGPLFQVTAAPTMLRPIRRGGFVSLMTGCSFLHSGEFLETGIDLAEPWGEVGHREKGGIHLLDELAIGFGLVARALPFGVVTESLPVGSGGIAARMRENVDESSAFERLVGRRPIGDVFHAMLLEEFHGVFAKAAQEVVELALVSVIDSKFVDRNCGWSGARFFLSRGKPVCRWEQSYCRERLK